MSEKRTKPRVKPLLRIGFCLAVMTLIVLVGVVMAGAEDVKYSEGLSFKSNGDGTCSVTGMGSCEDVELVIPPVSPEGDRVTYIDNIAFVNQTKLKSIIIPKGVTGIGTNAFLNCENVKSIILPDGLTYIGTGAFFSMSSIKNISLPDSVEIIEASAFNECYRLTEITIPEKVKKINVFTFANCNSLESVVLPENLEEIDLAAFIDCNSLKNIKIPKGVTKFGTHVFDNCLSLKSITLPEKITKIGGSTFRECTELESITLSNGLTEIDEGAFNNCSALTDVYFFGTKEEWNNITIREDNDALNYATIHFLKDECKLTGASVALGGSLTMRYYATINPDYGDTYVRFTFHGQTNIEEGVLDESTGEYVFSFGRIPPQCMGDNVKAELILISEDGTETVLDTKETYSIRQYCDDALAADPDNRALATLLADLLAYGAASQNYTNYQVDAPVNTDFEAAPSEWHPVPSTDLALSEATREDIRFSGAGVRFGYVNRIYYKIKAADLSGVTVTVNGKVYTAEDFVIEEEGDGTYYLYTEGIYATEFDKLFTAVLAVDGEVVQTLDYSVRSYVYAKQNSDNEDLCHLVKTLYKYGRSSIAYREEQ